jgi:two-component system cell cycle sensor histidine kinase/response regulator CckA
LAFSRKQPLRPEVLNLNTIVGNLGDMLKRLIGEDVEFTTHLTDFVGCVKADPGQIEQVIINLAVNARDAMPVGGTLTIETANVELGRELAGEHARIVPGSYVMLAVTDDGCGMDESVTQRIFEPFYTTKEKGRGTGLGLSTVYGIVKQSGGYIFVHSEPGHGTTFRAYLPRTEEQASPRTGRPAQGPLRGKGEIILVVEDESALRDIVREVLQDLGYRATVAANEALLAVEEHQLKPDLLVTDVVMPGMSGLVLAQRLRKTLPDLKVLFMSGYTDDSVVQHGVLQPGTPFIQKPFSAADLAAKVAACLSHMDAPA